MPFQAHVLCKLRSAGGVPTLFLPAAPFPPGAALTVREFMTGPKRRLEAWLNVPEVHAYKAIIFGRSHFFLHRLRAHRYLARAT